MSLVSLLELHRAQGSLNRFDRDAISYPSDGASNLAQVEAEHFWFTERRAAILWLLRRFVTKASAPDELRGIDLGCGSGFTAVWLSELGYPTLGIDAHNGFEKFVTEKRGFGFLQGNLLAVEPKAEFDFLLLLDTLEHIVDDVGFLEHAAKALKPGGIAIITVPAFSWLWSPADERAGHHRRYRKTDFKCYEAPQFSQLQIRFSAYFFFTTLPLFLMHRLFGRILHRSLSDDIAPVKSQLVNSLIKALLKLDLFLLKRTPPPLGSSLFVVLEKR